MGDGRRGGDDNAKAQRRREKEEKRLVGAGRSMGILPMTFHGRPARRTSCTPAGGDARLAAAGLRQAGATWKAVRLLPWGGSFPAGKRGQGDDNPATAGQRRREGEKKGLVGACRLAERRGDVLIG